MGRFITDLYFRFQRIIYSNDLRWKWTVLIKSVPSKTMLIEIHTRTPFNIKVLEFFPLDCLLSILSDSQLPGAVQFWFFGPSTFTKSDRPLLQTAIYIHLDSESWTIWTLVYYASIVMQYSINTVLSMYSQCVDLHDAPWRIMSLYLKYKSVIEIRYG